jgi:hypothetical protein
MSLFKRIPFILLIVCTASVTAFSQEEVKKDSKGEASREKGMRKISSRSNWEDIEIDIDELRLENNIERAVEESMEQMERTLENLEIHIPDIEINLGNIDFNMDPIDIDIPDFDMEELDIDIDPVHFDLEDLDIDIDLDNIHPDVHHFDMDMDMDMDIDDDDDESEWQEEEDDDNDDERVFQKIRDKGDKEKPRNEKDKTKGLKKIN